MVRFNCKHCGYKVNHDVKDKRCPYCNKPDALVEESDAEELISEA
jgi:rubrerythrin